MSTSKPNLRAIAATLKSLRAIVITVLQDVELLKQAAVLVQAILVLHRQS